MYLGRRCAAVLVDGVVSLLACAVLLMPFASLVDPRLWATVQPVPLLWAAMLLLLSLIWRGNTPGKKWAKLRLVGAGCFACREVRRLGWAVLFGLAQFLSALVPAAVTGSLVVLAAVWCCVSLIWPILRSAPEFPHNTETGFSVAS